MHRPSSWSRAPGAPQGANHSSLEAAEPPPNASALGVTSRARFCFPARPEDAAGVFTRLWYLAMAAAIDIARAQSGLATGPTIGDGKVKIGVPTDIAESSALSGSTSSILRRIRAKISMGSPLRRLATNEGRNCWRPLDRVNNIEKNPLRHMNPSPQACPVAPSKLPPVGQGDRCPVIMRYAADPDKRGSIGSGPSRHLFSGTGAQ
ncbi:hypothetical protein ABIF00_006737 [Bradyrhizobium elkanii]